MSMSSWSRQFVLRRAVKYARNNTLQFLNWLNGKVDIPGVSESNEERLEQWLATEIPIALDFVLDVIDGRRDIGEWDQAFSRREFVKTTIEFASNSLEAFLQEIDIPFLSEETESYISSMLSSFLEDDLVGFIESKF